MNLEKEIFDISLQDIIPNRFQPREMFDDEALKELSQSIKEHGVIQPIIVRKVGDKYEIIAGERRFRASQLAGKTTIPALVRDIDDKEAAKVALLENLQRSNLTPIEEAKTYQTILKLDNITQDELAQNLGKSQSTIANKLRLLTLDEEVQTALLNSQISERHARSLLGLDLNTQKELLHKIINEKLTVKALDEEIMRRTGKIPEEKVVPDMQEGSINQMTNNPQAVEVPQINQVPNIMQAPMPNNINQVQEKQKDPEINKQQEPIEHKENIFDRLRVKEEPEQEPQENNQTVIGNNNQQQQEPRNFGNIYDLRFAINNFRQAIQNTEKFGFKVNAQEYDHPDKYQIVIEIDKKN